MRPAIAKRLHTSAIEHVCSPISKLAMTDFIFLTGLIIRLVIGLTSIDKYRSYKSVYYSTSFKTCFFCMLTPWKIKINWKDSQARLLNIQTHNFS